MERCRNCGSAHNVPIRDLRKCNVCGETWVAGTGITDPEPPTESLAEEVEQRYTQPPDIAQA